MKQFCCGDVVPGCKATFLARDEASLLSMVGAHARADHGLMEIPAALLPQVHAAIREVNAAA